MIFITDECFVKFPRKPQFSYPTAHPHTTRALLPALQSWAAASWEMYENLRDCSSPGTLSLGFEETNHSVYQELLLLQNHFTVYKLKIGAQKKSALSILPAFGEHGQDDVSVADVRGSSLVWQEIQDFPSGPLPCCSHFIAGAEDVLNILNQVFSPAWLVLAVRIICSALLE